MKCEYCNQTIPPDIPKCPYCGAGNPEYDEFLREKSEESKQAAEVNKEISDYINRTKQQHEHKLEAQRRQREEKSQTERELVEGLKIAAISSFITAAITTAGLGAHHNIDYLSMYMLFYIGNLVGNMLLLVVLIGFMRNKKARYITYSIIVILLCIMFNSCMSEEKPSNSANYSYTAAKITEPVIPTDGKPVDGMTFAQLKEQKWGYKMLYTKCRDFDMLRPEKRYYEARWYNSDLKCIGYGLICFDNENEDEAKLVGFRDYTE